MNPDVKPGLYSLIVIGAIVGSAANNDSKRQVAVEVSDQSYPEGTFIQLFTTNNYEVQCRTGQSEGRQWALEPNVLGSAYYASCEVEFPAAQIKAIRINNQKARCEGEFVVPMNPDNCSVFTDLKPSASVKSHWWKAKTPWEMQTRRAQTINAHR